MAEVQENRIESSYTQNIKKELNEMHSAEAHDVNFSNTLSTINAIKNFSSELYFNTLISGKLNFDGLKKDKKKDVQDSTIQYIQDKENKKNVLDSYLAYGNNIPDWIKKFIENTYSYEEIGEYELEGYFNTQDIISLGKEICGENWDGSNMDKDNPEISNTCPGCFFTLEQLIGEFNKKNNERTNNNRKNLNELDILQLFDDIRKIGGKLYLNNEEFTDKSFEDPEIYGRIYQKLGPANFANENEFQKLISSEIIHKWISLLFENKEDEDIKKENKESNNLINSIESMKLNNISELTDGEEIQVENINHIFNTAKNYYIQRIKSGENKITNPNTIKKQIAYILGTAKGECHFKNVKEIGGEKKRYAPYYGRGFVQLTHYYNYNNFTTIIKGSGIIFKNNRGETMKAEDLNIHKHPNNVLESNELAAFILVYGSINGSFTGKKLDDYINDNNTNFLEARKVINSNYKEKYQNNANICLSHISMG